MLGSKDAIRIVPYFVLPQFFLRSASVGAKHVPLAHSIYLLQYHIIFVCKYRKKLLVSRQISDDIKQFSYEICQRHSVIIRYMETDKDHIHYMIETEPTMSISKIVNLMKSYTTYHIWKRYPQYLRKQFWKEHTFWRDGYFACSVGNVSEEMLKKYIENQG